MQIKPYKYGQEDNYKNMQMGKERRRNSKRYSRGESLTREDKMEDSWREYFEQLLNGGGMREGRGESTTE